MNKISESFDPNVVEWRNYKDLECEEYNINFDYSILGYDIEKGKLDMMLRYKKGRGGCRRHRHIAATTTIVIDGEQNYEAMVLKKKLGERKVIMQWHLRMLFPI